MPMLKKYIKYWSEYINQNFQNIDRNLFASAAASIFYHIVPCACSGLFNLEVKEKINNVTVQLFKMATSIFHWKELHRSKLNANFEPKSTLPGISREGTRYYLIVLICFRTEIDEHNSEIESQIYRYLRCRLIAKLTGSEALTCLACHFFFCKMMVSI